MNVDFTQLMNWIIANGYIIMFLLMCIEGPNIATASGFAASLGYFNPWIVFFLSILGDLIPDSTYYFIGRFSPINLIDKIGEIFKFKKTSTENIRKFLKNEPIKTIIAIKFTPIITVPSFIIIGSTKIRYIKFISVCVVMTLIKSSVFVSIGYYFGRLYLFNKYLEYGNILLFFIPPIIIIIFIIYRLSIKKITDGINNTNL